MDYWDAKHVADYLRLAPDSKGHLNGLKADRTLSSVATEYRMHPLMLPCWTCLIGKVVSDVGEAKAKELLKDDNLQTAEALNDHISLYGDGLPPSITLLVEKVTGNKVSVMKRPSRG